MNKPVGNNSELWEQLIDELDDKLQLGLLNILKLVTAYHFEDDTLFIEAEDPKVIKYFENSLNMEQLTLFAQTTTKIKKVKFNS